ncbi:MAG TPA: endonuclease/exonuclease/phosphatase family protein, partial [Pilimelia sp.]|nr:endonuclease/exonuclease/phosphatase family protein [Pilimelia sp.]
VPVRAATAFVVLQMNLCNSGMSLGACYSFGRAVDEAVGKIRQHRPDLVTLQEVCRDDLYGRRGWGRLARAMADLYGSEHISVSFVPAGDGVTGDSYRCVNGEPFGIAVMHRYAALDVHSSAYGSQDRSGELRVWMCTTVLQGRLTGCTTHLSTRPDVAMRQCLEVMSILTSSPWVMPEVIAAGDFNLTQEPGRPQNVRDCAPADYDLSGDGSVQHAFFTGGVPLLGGGHERMRWTDHPLLHQTFWV